MSAGLAIIAGLVLPPIGSSHHPLPKIDRAKLHIAIFQNGLEVFKRDNGYYPPSSNGLEVLVIRPADATNWHQYEDKIPLDPWDHPYLYECPGKHRTNSYDLSSAGPDGKYGTEDDIVNWNLPGGNDRPSNSPLTNAP